MFQRLKQEGHGPWRRKTSPRHDVQGRSQISPACMWPFAWGPPCFPGMEEIGLIQRAFWLWTEKVARENPCLLKIRRPRACGHGPSCPQTASISISPGIGRPGPTGHPPSTFVQTEAPIHGGPGFPLVDSPSWSILSARSSGHVLSPELWVRR